MGYRMIYVTAGSHDEALEIGRNVVESRLAACANILGSMTSVYWWEGKLEEDGEVAFILKTREEMVETVVEKVKERHSYDCPCVVALPIETGNADYLDWIDEQTKVAG